MPIPQTNSLPGWIEANVPTELVTSKLFRFDVKLQNKTVITVDILPDLEIDMEILEEQMQDIPAQYAFWASVYSELRLAVAIAERKLKIRKGKAIDCIQKEMKANNIRLSVEHQKLIIEVDSLLIEADARFAYAQMLAGKIWHMLKAIEMKHETCRSLIGLKRAEHTNS